MEGYNAQAKLEQESKNLRLEQLETQQTWDFVQVGDFSFYDQILDTRFLLGNTGISSGYFANPYFFIT
ncbi:hypothetical protein [uncultured Paraglaciecola sp.]|uniref:hypothetical protein n=1 Tax=uncultured Paraglaciecola sp. TaxID=1765024 RepID=UPI0030DA65B0